ncbi:DUF1758 domain-containing protein [Trichonephila clavipes]|nr:DUF1758 domain-containing protein [Trichonephila clavipes]
MPHIAVSIQVTKLSSLFMVAGISWSSRFSNRPLPSSSSKLVSPELKKANHSLHRLSLNSLARDDEIECYILEKQELLDTWEEMLILLERRVSHLNKTNKNTEVIHTRNSDSTEIKLSTLSLPTFSGVIDEWLTFSDLFQATVTNNQNLTGAQKLQYLKGVLKGDAQKIVQSLPITDVAGNVPSEDIYSSIAVNSIQVVTDELVGNFWKLDSVPEARLLTSEEKACEDHFIDTHVRNEDGRYVVRLPFHSSPSKLGDSKESAIRRFKSLKHSLIKKPAIYSQYRDFMQEYLTFRHMELVPKNDYAKRDAYYLPHHAVLRDSSTIKLRVVFDASAKSTSGYSLNDILMRDNPKETVKEYRLTTVTYGTSCAPYLSTRTLTQLAFDEKERYPLASFTTLPHFYVDDLLSGAATEKEAVELVWQLKEMMRKGEFNLRKCQSNSETVIKEVAENKDLKKMQNDEEIKIIGIQWKSQI